MRGYVISESCDRIVGLRKVKRALIMGALEVVYKVIKNMVLTVIFKALKGPLDCTRKSYIPPCRRKFALSEFTVSKFGKIFISRYTT